MLAVLASSRTLCLSSRKLPWGSVNRTVSARARGRPVSLDLERKLGRSAQRNAGGKAKGRCEIELIVHSLLPHHRNHNLVPNCVAVHCAKGTQAQDERDRTGEQ